MKPNNDKQKRKFLLVLPALIVPFATLFFWALGGGAQAQGKMPAQTGLNLSLPDANLKTDTNSGKLSFYARAQKDSLTLKQAQKDDPNYHSGTIPENAVNTDIERAGDVDGFGDDNYNSYVLKGTDPQRSLSVNEAAIRQRLSALQRQVNEAPALPAASTPAQEVNGSDPQLEALRKQLQSQGSDDADLKQMSGMLDKIMAIENPGLALQKEKEASAKHRGQVFAVTAQTKEQIVTTLGSNPTTAGSGHANGFYDDQGSLLAADSENAIAAVVNGAQTLVSGATVKLRLAEAVFVNGTEVPANTFVYGTAQLEGERLKVKVTAIRYQNSVFPVALSVYDLDGIEGINIPGAITRDVAKQSADQSIQDLGLTTYDPSLGAQAASAGITAAKSLLSRKVRLVKVQVKAGYKVLLRDEKQQQSAQ